MIMDHDWQGVWANKLPDDQQPLIEEVLRAAAEHAELHGIDPPNLMPTSTPRRSPGRRRAP